MHERTVLFMRLMRLKKPLLMMVLLTALLLLCGTALAESHPCDQCGGPTTCVGTGSWCHWYCAACDYTTSRNHNPNSPYSGLVPDSCSGTCAWCGASADHSSHTFANYTYNNDATCEENGTETGRCTNVQCGATDTRTVKDSSLGHDYREIVTPPGCTTSGITEHRCKRCGYSRYSDLVDPIGHTFENWVSNPDNTHTSVCSAEGCTASVTEPCSFRTTTVGGTTFRYCFVCNRLIRTTTGTGDASASDADDTADTVPASVTDSDTLWSVSVSGLMVLVDAAPLETELELDREPLYLLIVSSANALDAPREIKLDLKEFPYQVDEGDYADILPEALEARRLNLFYVGADESSLTTLETWYATTFTLNEGILTFTVDTLGVYLLMPAPTTAD